MHIGIIETGRPPDPLRPAHGSYPDMFKALLSRAEPSLTFTTYAALDGEVPDDPRAADAWLITGSRHGVYERLPWMLELESLIREAFAARIPVAGICFGHQIMASALGGTVVKSDRGWGLGLHTYAVGERPAWMQGAADEFSIPAVHQDQVVALPEGAKAIASSEFCENAAIAYDDIGFSVQGHPEFSEPFQRDLFEVRLRPIVPGPVVDAAERSFSEKANDAGIVADWIVRFLEHARSRQNQQAAAE